jgi:hypothetical protein
MQADWGVHEEYLTDSWPSEPLPPERLPAVVAARIDGWYLAPDAPQWAFLPAVWPSEARVWVPDRSVRLTHVQCVGGVDTGIPWSAWDLAENERDLNHMLMRAGIPGRPLGRLWLLKPSSQFPDLDAALETITAGAEADEVPQACCSEFVKWTHAILSRWFANSE